MWTWELWDMTGIVNLSSGTQTAVLLWKEECSRRPWAQGPQSELSQHSTCVTSRPTGAAAPDSDNSCPRAAAVRVAFSQTLSDLTFSWTLVSRCFAPHKISTLLTFLCMSQKFLSRHFQEKLNCKSSYLSVQLPNKQPWARTKGSVLVDACESTSRGGTEGGEIRNLSQNFSSQRGASWCAWGGENSVVLLQMSPVIGLFLCVVVEMPVRCCFFDVITEWLWYKESFYKWLEVLVDVLWGQILCSVSAYSQWCLPTCAFAHNMWESWGELWVGNQEPPLGLAKCVPLACWVPMWEYVGGQGYRGACHAIQTSHTRVVCPTADGLPWCPVWWAWCGKWSWWHVVGGGQWGSWTSCSAQDRPMPHSRWPEWQWYWD